MIGYHWAPHVARESIQKHGLLVPKKHPKLTRITTCSEGHRNPHISMGKSVEDAWVLSGGFIMRREREQGLNPFYSLPASMMWWDLWQVDLRNIRYRSTGVELQSRNDIGKSRLRWVAERMIR